MWQFNLGQSIDVIKYTDEEYEKFLEDPVSLHVFCMKYVIH